MRASPPDSLNSSWNGPEAGAFSHHGPSVVPREPSHQEGLPDQASHSTVQHGRRQGRAALNSPSPAQSQELPEPSHSSADHGNRPDSAAYKAKVTNLSFSQHAYHIRGHHVPTQYRRAFYVSLRQAKPTMALLCPSGMSECIGGKCVYLDHDSHIVQ